MRWFFYCLKHYADTEGRASRTEYWNNYAVSSLIGGALLLSGLVSRSGLVIGVLFQVAIFLPNYAATVRRLHDSGLTGSWAVLYGLSTVLIWVSAVLFAHALLGIMTQLNADDDLLIAQILNGGTSPTTSLDVAETLWQVAEACSVLLCVLMCRRSSPAVNSYGSGPSLFEAKRSA